MTKKQMRAILLESLITPSKESILLDVADSKYYVMKAYEELYNILLITDDILDGAVYENLTEIITLLAIAKGKLS